MELDSADDIVHGRKRDRDEDEYLRASTEKKKQAILRDWKSEGKEIARTRTGKVGVAKTLMMFYKSMVATGVLYLPNGYSWGGILFSSLCVIIVGLVSLYCMILLVKCKEKVGGSFGIIGKKACGNWALIAVRVVIVISQLGFSCAYFIFNAKVLELVLNDLTDCADFMTYFPAWVFILLQLIVFIPLSLFRTVKSFAIPAIMADVIVLLGIGTTVYYSIAEISDHGVKHVELFNSTKFAIFLGTSVYTFEGIALILPLHEAMADKKKMPIVLVIGMLTLIASFTGFAIVSFLAFGEDVDTIILRALPQKLPVQIVELTYLVVPILTFPLMLFPAVRIMERKLFPQSLRYRQQKTRETLNTLISSDSLTIQDVSEIKETKALLNTLEEKRRKKNFWAWSSMKKNIFRAILVLLMACVSIIGETQFDHFVSLIGTTCCIPIAFIFPALFHYNLCATKIWTKAIDATLVTVGVIMMVGATGVNIWGWVIAKPEDGPSC